MNMTIKTLPFVLMLALTGNAVCMGADLQPREIRLKPEATVSTEDLTLADVAQLGAQVPASVRDISLGRSPWPGHVRKISRVLVKVRLVSSGLSTKEFHYSGADCCSVRVNSIRVEANRIVEAARSYLKSCFPAGGPEARLELLRPVQAVTLPAEGGEIALRASAPGSGTFSGMVRVNVDLIREEARLKRVPVSFMVSLYDRAAVARHRIGRGRRLSRENTVFARREVTSLQGGYLRSETGLNDLQALRTIEPGTVITRHVAGQAPKPIVVERNQRVFLVVETETLRVMTLGKSLSRARVGEPVQAQNLVTGRHISGIATEEGLVRVPLGRKSDD